MPWADRCERGMLSKIEIKFLENPGSFGAGYAKSLRCRIRGKARLLRRELALLEEAGFFRAAENSGRVAEISCRGKIPVRVPFSGRGAPVVRSPGFEPGSSAWEADVLAKLDYDRVQQISQTKTNLNFTHYHNSLIAKSLSPTNPKKNTLQGEAPTCPKTSPTPMRA